tara:strand:+ start:257 stop:1102 length:846 start_codon:yes stop_codon:yes gene_type:complete
MSNDYNIDVEVLKEVCPIYNDSIDNVDANNRNITYNVSEYEANLLGLKDSYTMQVELGNSMINSILNKEEAYFNQKYGPDLYNYLKLQRKKFMNEKLMSDCKAAEITLGMNSGNNATIDTADVGSLIPDIQKDISNNLKIYNEFNEMKYLDSMGDINKKTDILNKNIVDLYSKTSINQRKVEYREEELKKVNFANNILTVLYYIVLLCYFMFLLSNNQLNLLRNGVIYVILIIFPIILYPIIFKYIKKMYNKLNENVEIHGPKNAFVNKEINLKFVDNHDI